MKELSVRIGKWILLATLFAYPGSSYSNATTPEVEIWESDRAARPEVPRFDLRMPGYSTPQPFTPAVSFACVPAAANPAPVPSLPTYLRLRRLLI